jgi:hypothetical protein
MTKKKNMTEELDAIDDELLVAIAKVKGHAVQKAVPQPVSKIYPMSAVMTAWLKAEEAFWNSLKPGQQMSDGTVYVGKYAPKDRSGKSLSLKFNVFAALEDLPGGPIEYTSTLKRIAGLRNWHGYNGTNYETDQEIYAALKDGTYKGGWIIPTSDILYGKDANGDVTMPDNLFAHKKDGALRDTFFMAPGEDNPDWYWTSTADRKYPDSLIFAQFSDEDILTDSDTPDCGTASCRPVRLVPRR